MITQSYSGLHASIEDSQYKDLKFNNKIPFPVLQSDVSTDVIQVQFSYM